MFKNFLFEYIYYRLYKLNANKDEYQGVPALLVVTFIQGMIFNGIVGLLVRSFFDRTTTAPYARNIAYLAVFTTILLIVWNYRKLWNNISLFEQRWQYEPSLVRKFKGWMIVLVIILSFCPLLIINMFL